MCYFRFPNNVAHSFFFFNDTATTEIYTLSLHDALPICSQWSCHLAVPMDRSDTRMKRTRLPRMSPKRRREPAISDQRAPEIDRKSTRLNSSHANISYAVFCFKKKK